MFFRLRDPELPSMSLKYEEMSREPEAVRRVGEAEREVWVEVDGVEEADEEEEDMSDELGDDILLLSTLPPT